MSLLRSLLTERRSEVARRFLSSSPDLDVGAGKSPKARLSLDIKHTFRPDVVGDIRFLPFKNEGIGSIVCSHVIEHVPEVGKVMSDIVRILRKDGIVVFFVPNEGSLLWRFVEPLWTVYYERMVSKPDSPKSHVHFFDSTRLEEYLAKYFRILSLASFNAGMELYAVCRKG